MALKINPITGKFDLLGSTPDWNQNNETATDYIKNRTHYEKLEDHREMFDDEYDVKVASGSTFVQVKMNSVTVESNEYLKDGSAGTETGSRQEYDDILNSISAGGFGNPSKNGTSTCKKIAINGIETTLEYLEHAIGSSFYDREGVFGGPFYGADGTADTTLTNIICCYGNGFMFKRYYHVEYGKPGYFLCLIDKAIYGEAPYTIDFYFECEQTIKKIDEKFLPDGIGQLKHKTGDVVCLTTKDTNTNNIKIIPWDTYKENPSSYDAIGLVVDPVKRTFLFAELSEYAFSTESGRELLGEYSSFNDGMETRLRINSLSGDDLAATFPIFYKMQEHGRDSVFYPRCWWDTYAPQYFVPAFNEWKIAYNDLCSPFYDDRENKTGDCGSAMDRLIAAKTGVSVDEELFFSVNEKFYSQISTMGINSAKVKNTYNAAGNVPVWTTGNNVTPIFGIYSEEEENA